MHVREAAAAAGGSVLSLLPDDLFAHRHLILVVSFPHSLAGLFGLR